jgi:hypothetical protein
LFDIRPYRRLLFNHSRYSIERGPVGTRDWTRFGSPGDLANVLAL